MTSPAEDLAGAIIGAQIKPAPAFVVGVVVSATTAPNGALLIQVSGVASDPVTCNSTGTFDLIWAARSGAVNGLPVIVISVAGQPFVFTTYTIGV